MIINLKNIYNIYIMLVLNSLLNLDLNNLFKFLYFKFTKNKNLIN